MTGPPEKVTPSKAKATPARAKTTPQKDKVFAGLSVTETKLLVLANEWVDSSRLDYEKLAESAGIKASSARTLYRGAKRKVDKFGSEGNDQDEDPKPAPSDDETPSAKKKTAAKPKPSPSKNPRKPKATKSKAAPTSAPLDTADHDADESDVEENKAQVKIAIQNAQDTDSDFPRLPGEPTDDDRIGFSILSDNPTTPTNTD